MYNSLGKKIVFCLRRFRRGCMLLRLKLYNPQQRLLCNLSLRYHYLIKNTGHEKCMETIEENMHVDIRA